MIYLRFYKILFFCNYIKNSIFNLKVAFLSDAPIKNNL